MLVYVGQGNMSPGSDNNGLLYSSLTSPGLHCRAIQSVYWSGDNKAPDTTNPTLLKDTVFEVVESWFGQESLSVVTLTYGCYMCIFVIIFLMLNSVFFKLVSTCIQTCYVRYDL